MLVSRVQEKRGDIRFMLRQDPTVQREVHSYLDDLNWLSQVRAPEPNRRTVASGREALFTALDARRKRRMSAPVRTLSIAASLTTFVALGISIQAARHELPQPVTQVFNGVFYREEHVKASIDLSTPSELSLETGPGFTN